MCPLCTSSSHVDCPVRRSRPSPDLLTAMMTAVCKEKRQKMDGRCPAVVGTSHHIIGNHAEYHSLTRRESGSIVTYAKLCGEGRGKSGAPLPLTRYGSKSLDTPTATYLRPPSLPVSVARVSLSRLQRHASRS